MVKLPRMRIAPVSFLSCARLPKHLGKGLRVGGLAKTSGLETVPEPAEERTGLVVAGLGEWGWWL